MGFGNYETEKSADWNNVCILDNSEDKSALVWTFWKALKFDVTQHQEKDGGQHHNK